MSFAIYDASIPAMIRMLKNLSAIIDKAVAQAPAKNLALQELLDARLAPDMFAFPRQIQIASDAAKGCAARLVGAEPPSWPDAEKTFPELKERIAKTVAYLESIDPAQCAGAEDRTIEVKTRDRTLEFSGRDFVNHFALPNFFFHITTAYGLLRMKGIDVGKLDYLGSP
jgi:uncharacterized protein